MLEAFLYIFLTFCAVVGFVQIIGSVSMMLMWPSREGCCYWVLPVSGHDLAVESRLRRCCGSLQWERWLKDGQLLVLDLGADQETLEICKAFAASRKWVRICTPQELDDIVGKDAGFMAMELGNL